MKTLTYSEKAVHLAHLLVALNGEYKVAALEDRAVRCGNILEEFHLAQYELGKELGRQPADGIEALASAKGILLAHYAN